MQHDDPQIPCELTDSARSLKPVHPRSRPSTSASEYGCCSQSPRASSVDPLRLPRSPVWLRPKAASVARTISRSIGSSSINRIRHPSRSMTVRPHWEFPEPGSNRSFLLRVPSPRNVQVTLSRSIRSVALTFDSTRSSVVIVSVRFGKRIVNVVPFSSDDSTPIVPP